MNHRRTAIALPSTSKVQPRTSGGSAASHRPAATAATCCAATAAVIRRICADARPARPNSWQASVGQPGSASARARSRHRRHGPAPGSTSGPTIPAPSRRTTGRCGTRSRISRATSTGSGERASASTTRSTPRPLGDQLRAVPAVTRTASSAASSPSIVSETGPFPCRCTWSGERGGSDSSRPWPRSASRSSPTSAAVMPMSAARRSSSRGVRKVCSQRSRPAVVSGASHGGGRRTARRSPRRPVGPAWAGAPRR